MYFVDIYSRLRRVRFKRRYVCARGGASFQQRPQDDREDVKAFRETL